MALWAKWLWLFSTQPLADIFHADQAAFAAIVRLTKPFTLALSNNFIVYI